MTEQSTALRLADRLESRWALHPDMQEAAAELRRLHEENERLRGIVPEVLERLNDELCDENELLKAQRDLLVRTLKDCEIALRTVAKDDDEFVLARHQIREVRAALKAVEE